MIKKIAITGLLLLLLSVLCFNTLASEQNYNIIQTEKSIYINVTLPEAPAGSEAGIVIYPATTDLGSYIDYKGRLDGIIVNEQKKVENDNSIELHIPLTMLPYGKIKVQIGSPYLNDTVNFSFNINKVTVKGNNNTRCDKNGEFKLLSGESMTLTFNADTKNPLSWLKVNEKQVLSDITSDFIYTTTALYEDTTIEFYYMSVLPGVYSVIQPPRFTVEDIKNNLSEDDYARIQGKISALFAAKAYSESSNHVRESAGFIVSKYLDVINLNKNECTNIPAKEVSPKGTYALLVYGDTNLKNDTYYVQSYAIYRNLEDGTKTTVYGNITPFKMTPFSENVYMESVLSKHNLVTTGINSYRLDVIE